jgi:hypothetical protein
MLPSKRILIAAISDNPQSQTLRAVVEGLHASARHASHYFYVPISMRF